MDKAPPFALKEIKTKTLFLKAFPLMQQLIREENGDLENIIDSVASLESWKKARGFGYRLYVAQNAKQIIGVIGFTKLYDPLDKSCAFRINNFIVDKKYRRQGIGKEIMHQMELIAKKEEANIIVLEVLPTNTKAIHFYKEVLGYVYACDRLLKPLHT